MRRALLVVLIMMTMLSSSGCAVFDGLRGSSALERALSLIPAENSVVQFNNLAAAKQRWGLSEVQGSAVTDESMADQFAKLNEHLVDTGMSGVLMPQVMVMGDWSWNALDVDWEISTTAAEGPPVTILKLREDLDMDLVIQSLSDAGMTASGEDGQRFDWDDPAGQSAPVFLSGVTVIADEHLLMAGPGNIDLADDRSVSLAGQPGVDELIAGLETPDQVYLQIGNMACVTLDQALGQLSTPEQTEHYRQEYGLAELADVDGVAVAIIDDTTAVVTARYSDDATASADAPRREQLLSTLR